MRDGDETRQEHKGARLCVDPAISSGARREVGPITGPSEEPSATSCVVPYNKPEMEMRLDKDVRIKLCEQMWDRMHARMSAPKMYIVFSRVRDGVRVEVLNRIWIPLWSSAIDERWQ